MKEHTYDIEPCMTMAFQVGDGSLIIEVHRIEVCEKLILFGNISYEDVESLFKNKSFHLDDQHWLTEWISTQNLEIRLKLDKEIFSKYKSEDELVTAIAHLEAEFVDEASWYVLEIFQKLPLPWDETEFVTIGIKTSHADY